MRRLTTFALGPDTLSATLDEGSGTTGILMATGGTQTRVGSHRMYERLARALAERGYSCFRYDRRGVGDSSGDETGYRASEPDLAAALAAFRAERPDVGRVIGFGLCDGASALALARLPIDGLILVNPWLVEATSGSPPPAAIRAHYLARLKTRAGWRAMLSGAISYRKLVGGIARALRPADASLAAAIAASLRASGVPVRLILATGDATAIAAADLWRTAPFDAVRAAGGPPAMIDTDSHTFARPGDDRLLLAAVTDALASFGGD